MATHTEADLQNKSLLKLRQLFTEITGNEFDNGMDKPALVQAILVQQKRQVEPAPAPAPTRRIRNKPPTTPATDPENNPVDEENALVTVTCGSHPPTQLSLAGKTIGTVRRELSQALNITTSMRARVNGSEVNDNYVLEGGVILEFVQPAGDKA
ncbi:MAG: hypothetical protein UU08_C0002G0029 [Candidatus Uhrbacteria bacterium GW2011_GWE2_40_58]|nr:MAG: hypothetical protein UT94_C0003G0013 [Candidatus Uhrbacteria bacterium GW2011_GWF2_40_263]KKR68178.1 MAG: hypothetical protein UU08_C0002G0029 [Candidatus Uhrbacteria bacterium GW2011_GWE2_40_58]OGL91865.1 MAG: hypothetical protein A2239_01595 [Candidatus Uhrbacteria bacterium RIFOXYA2_FULL_40_9]OGL97667.1 MAG: hypothetical protein A2332_00755 [Candidatus Uhrbacteria bacterium RIFOXYB2_FULL_41_18]HBK34657.1 hypothetical protein [Candidatus Uhrbacteria bacterium]